MLTDHNLLTSVDGLNALHGADEKFLVVPGEEVTSRVRRQAGPRQRPRRAAVVKAHDGGDGAATTLQRNIDGIRARVGRAAHQPSELRLGR